MPQPIAIPLDDDDRLADPPLLDLFREEPDFYVATLVPSDEVSAQPTLAVNISRQSIEGRRIAVLLTRIEAICGVRLLMASHLGGGDFTLNMVDGTSLTLSAMDNADAVEVFDRLKQMAVDAQTAYQIGHAHAPRWRSAI